jgi:hypothetical protein
MSGRLHLPWSWVESNVGGAVGGWGLGGGGGRIFYYS